MTPAFKPGDIVQLKSGGPAMTISTYKTHHSTKAFEGYYCEWFKGASKEKAHFEEKTLKTYVAPAKL